MIDEGFNSGGGAESGHGPASDHPRGSVECYLTPQAGRGGLYWRRQGQGDPRLTAADRGTYEERPGAAAVRAAEAGAGRPQFLDLPARRESQEGRKVWARRSPAPDAAAAIRGAEGELDAIFSSAGQFLDDLDIIFEEGERQGYEGEGLAGIRVSGTRSGIC